MTEEQVMEKVGQLMDNLKDKTLKDCRRLYRSGGVDPQAPEYAGDENFLLAKVLIAAAWPFVVRELRPITAKARAAAANLSHF